MTKQKYLDSLANSLDRNMTYNRQVIDLDNIKTGIKDYLQHPNLNNGLTFNYLVDLRNIEYWIVEAN